MNIQYRKFWCEMIINSIKYTNNPYLHESSEGKNIQKHKRSAFNDSMCKNGVTKKDINEVINSGNLTDKSEVAAISFKGAKFEKLLSSDNFSNFLTLVDNHNQTANALVALVTAGMIRPTLTMAIPGMKDKKDKIYSATQAISSGFLGFGVTMALTKPLDDALHKVKKDPDKYNCTFLSNMNKKIKKLEKNTKTASGEELKNLLKQKKTLDLLVKNIPEWAICVPRAALTIALIPLILKYVFGLEKKPKNAQPKVETNNIQQQNNFEQLKSGKDIKNFLNANNNNKNVSFHGKLPEATVETIVTGSKYTGGAHLYDKFTDFIANKFTTPIINSKALQNFSNKWKDSEFLFNHMATVTSAVISSVYMQRTLSNDNLEDDKKKILAINQGLTFLLSTSLSYLIDSKLNNWWEGITAKFIGAKADDKNFAQEFKTKQKEIADKIKAQKGSKDNKSALKPLKALDFAKQKKLTLPTNIDALVNGLGVLKKMIIIGAIFRLAVPLVATPMASALEEIRTKHAQKQERDDD